MSKLDRTTTQIRTSPAAQPQVVSILIVDDQRFDRIRLRRLCAGLGFEVLVNEADSLAALGEMLGGDRYDIVLLDQNLPDGTGMQGIEVIRAHSVNRNAATIMVTGEGATDIAVEALKRGCSDYISKDELSVEALKRSTINALEKSRLTIGMETQETKRQQMQDILQRFARECAQEVKPLVSRMMRQMRDLREPEKLNPEQMEENVDRIEKSCMRLWEFLDDLDSYQGRDLAEEAFAGVTVAEALDITSGSGQRDGQRKRTLSPKVRPSEKPEPSRPAPVKEPPKGRPSVFGPRR